MKYKITARRFAPVEIETEHGTAEFTLKKLGAIEEVQFQQDFLKSIQKHGENNDIIEIVKATYKLIVQLYDVRPETMEIVKKLSRGELSKMMEHLRKEREGETEDNKKKSDVTPTDQSSFVEPDSLD
jgi:hypothetical protein